MPVELLAPAGSPEALDAAVAEGADAVYLGLKNFNARMRSGNFAYSQFEGALRSLRRQGRKLYVTVNTVFEQREADRMFQFLKYLAALGPDGIIVQDFGVITMVRENFPALRLHASTQMNIASARGANVLSRFGFSRVVLARELCLEEIRSIREATNMELEVFVHGALCMSVSGLCLFSSFLGGKSANRGMCTQACRRYYTRYEDERSKSSPAGNFSGDRHGAGRLSGAEVLGGYYFSPYDLELIEAVPALAEAGAASFKIEGRMKSAEYVGAVVSAYRRVIDSLGSGEAGIRRAMDEARKILRNDFARAKTVFNFYGSSGENSREDSSGDPPAWLNPNQNGGTGIPLGRIIRVKGGERERRGLIPGGPVMPGLGDSLRFHKADDSNRLSHKIVFAEDEAAGERVDRWISIPEGFEPGDAVYLIQTKAMSRRYPPVIPHNLDAFRRLPGRDQAPPPARPEGDFAPGRSASRNRNRPSNKAGVQGRGHRTPEKDLPEGLYVEVSRVEDLYILQSLRPAAVMLNYSARTALRLAGPQPLPFKSEDTIIALDPFFPQSEDPGLTKHIPLLMSRGYRKFVINNPGHFSLFRGLRSETKGAAPPLLIAGPYLYGFNRWALAFLRENGAEYFISPLENNRQNLEKTFPREGSWPGFRSQAMITLFAWPPLFRVRANLGKIYDFGVFSDREGGSFRLAPSPETSLVYPETPFSLVDKLPFLREAGFGRFILDLSARPLRKAAYRDLMTAVNNASPLPEISRFNWKNGFYTTGD